MRDNGPNANMVLPERRSLNGEIREILARGSSGVEDLFATARHASVRRQVGEDALRRSAIRVGPAISASAATQVLRGGQALSAKAGVAE